MASEAVSRTVTNRRWVLASRPDGKFSGKRDARLEDQLVALDDREDGTTIVQVFALATRLPLPPRPLCRAQTAPFRRLSAPCLGCAQFSTTLHAPFFSPPTPTQPPQLLLPFFSFCRAIPAQYPLHPSIRCVASPRALCERCDILLWVHQVETLSIDAFIRTMLDEKAYHGAIALGDVIPALGYGTVLASSTLKSGTRVMGLLGAQTVCTSPDAQLNKMPALPRVQPREWLGMLGLTTGITAWVGIYKVVRPPRKGETVVVSAAAGAAGSIAAQLAKLTGARVLGIAGGEAKGQFLTETLKLDGAIDYKADESLGTLMT